MNAKEQRGADLYAVLVDAPNGLTIPDMCVLLDWQPWMARQAKNTLQHTLGVTDSINLVCEPGAYRKPWVYKLVGTLDDARWWATNRLLDTESRLHTQHAVIASIVRGTDGRTLEGRTARLMEKTLRRLEEDLTDLRTT